MSLNAHLFPYISQLYLAKDLSPKTRSVNITNKIVFSVFSGQQRVGARQVCGWRQRRRGRLGALRRQPCVLGRPVERLRCERIPLDPRLNRRESLETPRRIIIAVVTHHSRANERESHRGIEDDPDVRRRTKLKVSDRSSP